jgi:hypothetical protein
MNGLLIFLIFSDKKHLRTFFHFKKKLVKKPLHRLGELTMELQGAQQTTGGASAKVLPTSHFKDYPNHFL